MKVMKQLCVIATTLSLTAVAGAQTTISDNDCTISINPTTFLIPQSGDGPVQGTSGGIVIFTVDFATQGCSCVEVGDTGFDNPDGILLITPQNVQLTPFRFNDIDGYAQFEYEVSAQVQAAGGGVFGVQIFDSCGGGNVLVDSAQFDIDFDFLSVPAMPLDVDGNSVVDPLTDTILALRYAFGFRGSTLITGAVAMNCTRCNAPAIEAYLLDLSN